MKRWDLRSVDVEPHQPEVLHSEGEGRTILISLPAGEALEEHQVHERAWLFVVDGEIEVAGRRRRRDGRAGLPRGVRSERAPRGPRSLRCAPAAAAGPLARRRAPSSARRLGAVAFRLVATAARRVEIPLPHRRAGHCGSGALRDLLEFHGLSWTAEPLSEGMVFGLGAGLGFAYVELPEHGAADLPRRAHRRAGARHLRAPGHRARPAPDRRPGRGLGGRCARRSTRAARRWSGRTSSTWSTCGSSSR